MKRINTFLALLMCLFIAHAQDGIQPSNKILRFVYIAHDHTTPVQELATRLTDIYEANIADENKDPLIFYLASGSNPIVVKVNIKDDSNNPEDFEKVLLPELYERNSHDVSPMVDVSTILDIFEDIIIADNNGKLRYLSSSFTFFVNPMFWDAGYNESVIVPIYFGLDLPEIKEGRVNLEIYQPKNYPLHIIGGKPFGLKNVGGINDKTRIFNIDN